MNYKSNKKLKILVVNPYGIGDILFTTPLIRNLKQNFPDCFTACLLGSRTKEIFEKNPYVDKIFTFDKGAFDKVNFAKKLKMLLPLLRELRKEKFGLMIDISNAPEYSFLAKFFFGIKTRVGFDYKNRGRFLTHKVKLTGYDEKHIIEYYLDLIRLLGFRVDEKKDADFFIAEEDEKFAEDFLKENDWQEDEGLFGIVPGGGKSWGKDAFYKHWPKENFAEVANQVFDKFGLRAVIFGGPDEIKLTKEIEGAVSHNCLNACARASLRQTAALMQKCKVVVANDGGPLHIAVSRGVETVSVFGPVDEKVYGPYPVSSKHKVLTASVTCRPCYKNFKFTKCETRECLIKVSPQQVFEVVQVQLT